MTQEKALALLKSGRNVFLTGSAGTGKTYTLNTYIAYLKAHKVPVAITASTGIAATHINGMTIHAWSGIGVRDFLSLSHLQKLRQKKYMRDKMAEVRVLIIDEISMLHKKQLNLVNEVLQYFKDNTLPFGGIQVVFSGDFFQLPPVGELWETSRDKFCFMSEAWVEAAPLICYLTEQYRQERNFLNDLLNEIRAGEVSPYSQERVREKIEEAMYCDTQRYPQLYTHNIDVDRINQAKLREINTPPKLFKATKKGNATLRENLMNSILAPEEIELKIGAEVMFVKNNFEKGFFNGTLGLIKEFSKEGFPIVETKEGRWIEAKPEEWKIEDENGKILAAVNQVPLRLAWAITIHKSQGMTLDEACVDLRKTFETGQGYVALSRLRSMEGLTLLGVNPMAMQLDDLAFKANKRFIQLSRQVEDAFTTEDLSLEATPFIVKCGGVVNPVAETSTSERKIRGKKSTLTITRELVEQGHTIEEIIEKRDLSESTIYGHFNKIKETHPATDFSGTVHCSEEIVEAIRKAVKNMCIGEEEKIPLKKIYEYFNQSIPYSEIRKALLLL